MSAGIEGMEIRRARASDLPAIQRFVAATYGTTAPFKRLERWTWQYVDNPFRPPGESRPTVWIALSKDEVAGQIAVQDAALWFEGECLRAGWIVDVMIHPRFRGRGLGHAIHDVVARDRTLLVTLTMAPATRRIAERAGCVTLGETRQYICPIGLSGKTIRRFLAQKAPGKPRLRGAIRFFNATRVGPALLATAARGFTRIGRALRSHTGAAGFDVEEVTRFPDFVNVLWQRERDAYPAVFERSCRFLNWRFCDSPDLEYRRFLLRRDGALRGYVVTRKSNSTELPLGVVADFFASSDDAETQDALLKLARDVLEPDCEYIEAAASTPAYRAALGRAGFVATRRMRPTVVCSDATLKARIEQTRDHWHFTKADHDWDQIHPA